MSRAVINVDTLDFEILREVYAGHASYYRSERVTLDSVARALGVNPKTVASRVRRMKEAGFGWPLTVGVDPASLGMVRGKVFLAGANARDEEMVETLRHIEGLQLLIESVEGLDVIIHAEDQHALDVRVELARRITGAKSVSWDFHSARDFPPHPPYDFARLDLLLLALLAQDARAPFSGLAKTLGVTARSVERRFEKLARDGVVTMLPGGDGHTRVAGMLVKNVTLGLREGRALRTETLRAILDLFRNHFVRNLIPTGRVYLLVYSDSPAELEEQLARAGAIPGVASVATRSITWIGANPRYPAWLASVLSRRAETVRSMSTNRTVGFRVEGGGIATTEARAPTRRR